MTEILRKIKTNKPLIALISCMVISIVSISLSSGFQSNFGQIDVQIINFTGLKGENLVAKIYRPITATSDNKAPGILAIHGFNNDKDVFRPTAIELARAGLVVLCIDQNGHGKSDGTYEENWNYPGNSSYLAAWNYLHNNLTYVDNTNLGVIGHSMGSLEIYYFLATGGPLLFTPIAFQGCKAMVLETFGPDYYLENPIPGTIGIENYTLYKNVLHVWALYEEFAISDKDSTATWIAKGLGAIDLKYNR